MARSAGTAGVSRWLVGALGVFLAASALHGERRVSLEQLGQRNPPDFLPILAGQTVLVRGVVIAPAFHFTEYTVLAISDVSSAGVLKVSLGNDWLDKFHPGDELEAEGKV